MFKKVIDIAREQITEIVDKSKIADRKITLGGKVIMTSVKNVGQASSLISMSDLAKYINSMTEMASGQEKVFIPKSWETFGNNCYPFNLLKIIYLGFQ